MITAVTVTGIMTGCGDSDIFGLISQAAGFHTRAVGSGFGHCHDLSFGFSSST
jgi:hypothetical protein